MGTNQGGITKYDGSRFGYINMENGLSDNVVYAINESNSKILIGTNNGLTVIQGLDTVILNAENGLPHPGVVSILVSKTEDVWLGTGKGLAKLSEDSIHVIEIDSLLSASTILNIREGSDGALWFCTVQNGLFRWDGKSVFRVSTSNGLAHNYVFDVLPNDRDGAWVFSYKGLYQMRGSQAEPLDDLPNGFPSEAISYGYAKDSIGNIWIGTSAGVLKFHDNKFEWLTTKNGLVNNNIWKVLHDREGNIWFGSKSNGVSKLTSERFKLHNSRDKLPNEDVTAVMRSIDGSLWLGTHRGIAKWNGNTETTLFQQQDGLSSETIRDFGETADGTVYHFG